MFRFNLFTKLATCLTLLLPGLAIAQIMGPSVKEVKFSYTASFEMPINADEETDLEKADMHASHIVGLFHSPKFISFFRIPGDMPGGIGAPRSNMAIKILSSETIDDKVHITYENSGKMILHNNAAAFLLARGFMDLPLPVNPYDIYDEKCTDEHYTSFGDFWYFYDPYRKGCEYLSEAPKASKVRLTISPVKQKKMDEYPKLPVLRGNNKNGSLFLIYAIHGFESSPSKDDSGKENFVEFNDYLLKSGFSEERIKPHSINPINIYKKQITLDNGNVIDVEVRHLSATTSISSSSLVFAQFFKDAVENADVILYGGHSGLGGNLDLDRLQDKVGKINFRDDKKQIFFFDSCASYAYYLENFANEKKKSKIDIISYGLSSYFHTSNAVWMALMERLLATNSEDVPWKDILKDMESVLEGDTYLLNVGGI